jgi:hypothetical protein
MVLHIISFDIPYPPNYGGVIDVYHRIKALAEAGVRIVLHCFAYGRPAARELSDLCAEVHYYDRKKPLASLPVKMPHITYSRRSKALLHRLQADQHPIWFEGLHSCYYLEHPSLKQRKKFVRMHNIEWQYYQQLAGRERDLVKRKYLQVEARALKKYEIVLWEADKILAISPNDQQYLLDHFVGVDYLPAFHPYEKISAREGRGDFCLYHANLKVAENHQAAEFLIREVFAEMQLPLIIAGADPSPELIQLISDYPHISLRHNPGEGEMRDLMDQAHVHVLPTFQPTGIKLKLLASLFTGRFVLCNGAMVNGTGLEDCCLVADRPGDWRSLLPQLFRYEFTEAERKRRQEIMGEQFSNARNAERILKWLEE